MEILWEWDSLIREVIAQLCSASWIYNEQHPTCVFPFFNAEIFLSLALQQIILHDHTIVWLFLEDEVHTVLVHVTLCYTMCCHCPKLKWMKYFVISNYSRPQAAALLNWPLSEALCFPINHLAHLELPTWMIYPYKIPETADLNLLLFHVGVKESCPHASWPGCRSRITSSGCAVCVNTVL